MSDEKRFYHDHLIGNDLQSSTYLNVLFCSKLYLCTKYLEFFGAKVHRMLSHQKVCKIQGTIYTHKIVQKPSVELWPSQILKEHHTSDVVDVV